MTYRVYLAGPMTGLPEFNFPAFRQAAKWLREVRGWHVISPAEMDDNDGFRPGTDEVTYLVSSEARAGYLCRDLKHMLMCDGVVMLNGWSGSVGANVELFVARACGLGVHELVDLYAAQIEGIPERQFKSRPSPDMMLLGRHLWEMTADA